MLVSLKSEHVGACQGIVLSPHRGGNGPRDADGLSEVTQPGLGVAEGT